MNNNTLDAINRSSNTTHDSAIDVQYIEDLCLKMYGKKPLRIVPKQVMGRSADYHSKSGAFFAISLTVFKPGNDLSNE